MLDVQLFIIPVWFNLLFAVTVATIAFWKGGWRERALGAYRIGHSALWAAFPTWWDDPLLPYRVLSEQLLLLGICLACAHRSSRYWTMWACSIALVQFVGDLLFFWGPELSTWAHASANRVWMYAMNIVLLWACLSPDGRHAREATA